MLKLPSAATVHFHHLDLWFLWFVCLSQSSEAQPNMRSPTPNPPACSSEAPLTVSACSSCFELRAQILPKKSSQKSSLDLQRVVSSPQFLVNLFRNFGFVLWQLPLKFHIYFILVPHSTLWISHPVSQCFLICESAVRWPSKYLIFEHGYNHLSGVR